MIMQYIQVQFECSPNPEALTDVLSAQLGEIGFESFVRTDTGLEAYIPSPALSREKVDGLLADFPLAAEISYSCREMEDRNWNEVWERNYFQPVIIDDVLYIHSSFHRLEGEYRYRILIDPKMSFGTGHHQTTELMIRELLKTDLQNKSLLDMGCGTAVLSILASLRGASPITAVDTDEWAYRNATENVRMNVIGNIRLLLGGAELLGDERYDVILANITRNILLRDIPAYARVLNANGTLVTSGFYKEDIPVVRAAGEACGLAFGHFSETDRWVSVTFCSQ
ncbi:MAG: 50S ribosomal protein L11 methyltransferase [Proteiniphilum sp.]|nr:50S ribosomal protein L11 methyltransferase [Proteiniphilum sp.]